jgi:hypothetical protein
VTLKGRTRRRSCARTTNTNRTLNHTVGTVAAKPDRRETSARTATADGGCVPCTSRPWLAIRRSPVSEARRGFAVPPKVGFLGSPFESSLGPPYRFSVDRFADGSSKSSKGESLCDAMLRQFRASQSPDSSANRTRIWTKRPKASDRSSSIWDAQELSVEGHQVDDEER